jgi:hypothetical protein
MDKKSEQFTKCKQCKSEIPIDARLCSACNSYQDWRNYIPFSNTALALLTALISVIGATGPELYKVVHTPQSKASITMPSIEGTTLRIIVTNRGDAPALLGKVGVDSELLAGATKVKLRNDADAIIQPGSKLLTFDIIPLLDEDESYRESLEIMSLLMQNKPVPPTKIDIQLFQSDGRYLVQAIPIAGEQLFTLLRSNSDRCSTIKTPNFENGCIGAGSSNEAQQPPAKGKVH